MHVGRHERVSVAVRLQFPKPSPSRLGGGESYSYFDEESDISDVLVCTDSITLARKGAPLAPRIPWFDATHLLWTLVRGRNSGHWWPMSETLGLFLILRSTSITGLNLCTGWYAEATRAGLNQILDVRSVALERQQVLMRNGCRCLACELSWLADGWVCPWARF